MCFISLLSGLPELIGRWRWSCTDVRKIYQGCSGLAYSKVQKKGWKVLGFYQLSWVILVGAGWQDQEALWINRPEAKWQWSGQHDAFMTLRQAMTEAPVLAIPNAFHVFVLDINASDLATGTKLGQVQDGVEQSITYASKVLNSEQVLCNSERTISSDRPYQAVQALLAREFLQNPDRPCQLRVAPQFTKPWWTTCQVALCAWAVWLHHRDQKGGKAFKCRWPPCITQNMEYNCYV